MPANAAIYLPIEKIDLSTLFPGTKSDKGWWRAATYFDVPLDGETVRFTILPRHEMPRHLIGFRNYIHSLPDAAEEKDAAINAIQHTKTVLGLMAKSEFAENPALWPALFFIADRFNGHVFAGDSVLRPNGSTLVGPMGKTTTSHEDRKKRIQEIERKEPSKEASDRKARSLARLKREGVPAIEHLPVIADTSEAKSRSADEIARRAIAICLTAVKGEGLEQSIIDSLVRKHGADQFLSPKEAAFLKNPVPSQHDRLQFSWRYECYWVLLWALGYIETLQRPENVCDVALAVGFLRDRTTEQFINDSRLRPLGAILDEADLIYRYDWAVVDARVSGKETPANLDAGVVTERHHALNWLVGYMDQHWDDVSTDT